MIMPTRYRMLMALFNVSFTLIRRRIKFSTFRQKIADWITVAKDKLVTASPQVDSNVKPNYSISCGGTPTPSRRSRNSSSVSSRGIHTS